MPDVPDGLAVETHGYSRDKFYTASVSNNGQHASLRVNVPIQIKAQLDTLVASRSISAYKTFQCFVRDAIVHRLHDIADMAADGKLQHFLGVWGTLTEMEQRILDIEMMQMTVQKTMDLLARAHRYGDTAMIQEVVESATAEFMVVREPYRSKALDEIARYMGENLGLEGAKEQVAQVIEAVAKKIEVVDQPAVNDLLEGLRVDESDDYEE